MITLHPFLPFKTPMNITPTQPNLTPLSSCDLTEDAETKSLDKIKVNETPGSDCIAPRVLREAK